MAFNPLRAIVDLAGKIGGGINEGLMENKYGPNYKDQVDFLTRQRALNTAKEEAGLANVQAQTRVHNAAAASAENPDAFSVFTHAKTPMMLTTADDPKAIPGPAGTNTFFRPLTLEEQAGQAGKVATAKNMVGGQDIRAQQLQQKYDAMAATAKSQTERDAIRFAHQRELRQMGIDASLAKPYKITSMDASGNPQDILTTVGGASGMATGAGGSLPVNRALTGTPQTRLTAARLAIKSQEHIGQLLADPETQSYLGGLEGRITTVEQLLGAPSNILPPKLQKLQGALMGFFDNNSSVHGFRNAGAAEQKRALLASNIRDAPQIMAGLEGINSISQFMVEDNANRVQSAPSPKVQSGTGAGAAAAATGAPGGAFDVNAFIKSGYGKGTP